MSTVNAGWRGPNIVKEGLVLYLDAASGTSYSPYNSGTTWRDISVSGRSSTLINGPTFSNANAGIIVFDGIDDYAYSNTSVLGDTTTCTLEMICIFSSLPNYSALFYIGVSQFNHNLPYICFSSFSSQLYFSVGNYSSGIRLTNSAISSITANAWHHCVGTMGGGVLNLYIDGSFRSSYTLAGGFTIPLSGLVTAIYGGINLTNYTSGSVGLARVYNRALTPEEVLQNYNSTKGRFGL